MICLSVILIDLFLEQMNTIILKFFWKECNYYIKERKIHNYIADDLEISPDSDEDILDKIQIKKNSDEEDSNEEEDSDEKK